MDKLDLIVKMIEASREDHRITAEKLDRIEKNVDINTKDLSEHMRRTELNEDRIKLIEERHSIKYLVKLIIAGASAIGVVAGAIYKVSQIL